MRRRNLIGPLRARYRLSRFFRSLQDHLSGAGLNRYAAFGGYLSFDTQAETPRTRRRKLPQFPQCGLSSSLFATPIFHLGLQSPPDQLCPMERVAAPGVTGSRQKRIPASPIYTLHGIADQSLVSTCC